MDINDIQQAVQDVFEAAADDPAKLERLIAAAVRYYNRWNPLVRDTTLTTVSGQETYACPDGCTGIVKCVWWPKGEPLYTYTGITAASDIPTKYRRILPTERMIDEINRDFERRSGQGYYEYRANQNELILSPPPSIDGQTIYLTYRSPHALNEDGTGYDTIPEEDLSLLRDLTLAEMLQAQQVDSATDIAWAIGLVQETPQARLPALRLAIKEYRLGVANKYGESVALLG
jgi:hypothetical protein